jgi:NAD(P)-dependent dehydrogenase (short-subunit alcohol dehydrogenase family)
MSLINKTAVITGATGGVGTALSHALAGQNANLVLLDRDPDRLASLVNDLALPESRLLASVVNLLDPAEINSAAAAVAARFERADILLHFVGGWTGGKTLINVPVDDLELMLNQHVWTSFHVVQAFVPAMQRNGWGRIVMITSSSATRPNAKGGPYAIGKAGQEALMLTLSQELKGSGVTANLLQARMIDVKREKVSAPTPENAAWTTPEEFASTILYLLSDEAGTINGAKIPMFGSYS